MPKSDACLICVTVAAVAWVSLAAAANDLTRGQAIYDEACIACHGADGAGSMPGVPDLTGLLSQEDAVLLKRMADGFQSPGSPMAMPPRGGAPALTNADLETVLKFMREEFQPDK